MLPVNERFVLYFDDEGDYVIEAQRQSKGQHLAAHGSTPDLAVTNMEEVLRLVDEDIAAESHPPAESQQITVTLICRHCKGEYKPADMRYNRCPNCGEFVDSSPKQPASARGCGDLEQELTYREKQVEVLQAEVASLQQELAKPEHYWRRRYKEIAVVDVVQKRKAEAAERERDEWRDKMQCRNTKAEKELARVREALEEARQYIHSIECNDRRCIAICTDLAALQPQVELPAKGEKNG